MTLSLTWKRAGLAACCAGAVLLAPSAQSANWLMLQGTESPKAPKHRFVGFIQPTYTANEADPMSGLVGGAAGNNGKVVANNVVSPWFDDKSQLYVKRARGGARGKLTDKINYFAFFEVAPNLLTYDPFGNRARTVAFDHLSLTFNHLPGARIRAGLFKNPGSEELLQAIQVFDYIEFTDFTARVNLERFVDGVAPLAAGSVWSARGVQGAVGTPTNEGYGFSGGRDWGLQLFDSFRRDKWDLSYAIKVGRGEAIQTTDDNDFNPELYLYASAEYDLPGGKGPRKNGVKLYAWHQQGKRDFETDPTDKNYDRIRQGVGFKAVGNLFGSQFKHRVSGEFMLARGVIFTAPAGNVAGGNLQYALDKANNARGWYLDYGFYLNKNWQFDVRYDRDDLLYDTAANIDPGNGREIEAWTFGVNYHFTPKMRLTFNYAKRQAEPTKRYAGGTGPDNALNNNIEEIVGNLDDRWGLQFTWIY